MNLNSQQQQELSIGGYVGYESDGYGMDTYEKCRNKPGFVNFPHQISYKFNELGYRERPLTEYQKNSIICIGDSFTVGLGLPVEMTYPYRLEKLLNYPVLNFSLDGASNQWIKRKLEIILKYFTPPAIVVHYTFTHRRENNEPTWFDNERTLSEFNPSDDAIKNDYTVWRDCHDYICSLPIPTVHSCITNWHPRLVSFNDTLNFVELKQIDFARDWFHYGERTCQVFAEDLASKISNMGALGPSV